MGLKDARLRQGKDGLGGGGSERWVKIVGSCHSCLFVCRSYFIVIMYLYTLLYGHQHFHPVTRSTRATTEVALIWPDFSLRGSNDGAP